MIYKHNKALVPLARTLRKNMTKQERKLWYEFLRTAPVRFQRQKPIGNYIVDFYCAEAKLVIELDGSQHYGDAGLADDAERDAYLSGLGLTVKRYSNADVDTRFDGVCEDIASFLKVEQRHCGTTSSVTAAP